MSRLRRLLTISRSYTVGLNRRLAHELALAEAGEWEVVAAAPKFIHGDLRPIHLEQFPGEACRTVEVTARLTRIPHLAHYGCELRALLREPWDLVHAWEEPYIATGFQIARSVPAETPLVFWTAQNIGKRYPPPFSWFESYCVRRCSGWLACGETTAQTMLKRPGYGDKPHRVIPLGVDLQTFRPNRAAGEETLRELGWNNAGPPVVGYLGRFTEEKGIGLLRSALEQIKSPWRALFVGGGPLEAELRAWGAAHGDRVRVVTGVEHDRVPQYLNAMDLLAAPSQTTRHWREQLGRMLIEAMACGVPVVAGDSGEIPYVVGDAGIVLPEADALAWSTALHGLLESPVDRASVAQRGLQRAHDHFAWGVVARRHWEFFDSIIANRKAP